MNNFIIILKRNLNEHEFWLSLIAVSGFIRIQL